MSKKKVDLSEVKLGRTNVDRNYEQQARPSSGSATPKHKLSASQADGSGSANGRGSEIKNGMEIILGSRANGTKKRSQSNERVATKLSKTPDKRTQSAKSKIKDRENGTYDRTGGW